MCRLILISLLLAAVLPLTAQVPQIINYQGKIAVGTTPFSGTGQFRFALVNGNGSASYWSNDGTSTAGGEPTAAVSLPVVNGLYIVPLGDATLANMTTIPATVFTNADVRARVWFNDGSNGSQLLAPDQRITSVGYAMVASTVPDGAITTAKLAPGIAIPGTVLWENVTSASLQAQSGRGYLANNVAEVTITLPASPGVGDIVRVSGAGVGGWRVAQNAGQSIAGTGFVTDWGTTWTQGTTVPDFVDIAASADGVRLVAGTTGGQVYTSQDSGSSWVVRYNGSGLVWVASSADGTKLVAAPQGGQVVTSTNSGVTWTPRSVSGGRCVASSSDGMKLVVGMNGGSIFTSTDAGATWTARESTRAWYGVASSSDGSKLVAVVNNGLIYTSTDSGVTWTPRESSRSWFHVASSADGSKLVAVVRSGNIFTSSDSGATWTARDGTRNWWSVASSSNGTRLVATITGSSAIQCIYTSTDSGVTWTPRGPGLNWCDGVASSADGSVLVTMGLGSSGMNMYRSSPSQVIPSTTTVGATGFLSGGQKSAVELQHIGGGLWFRLSGVGTIFPN